MVEPDRLSVACFAILIGKGGFIGFQSVHSGRCKASLVGISLASVWPQSGLTVQLAVLYLSKNLRA